MRTDTDHTFPLDDIQSILLDNLATSITANVLSQLSKNNIAVIVSDVQHLPTTTLLPIQGYYHKLTALRQQLTVPKRFKDRLWQKIIRRKILNQSAVLNILNVTGGISMSRFASAVKEGDSTHQEGYAAAFYFQSAFGEVFSRRTEDVQNAALNYGYAIIRSCVAREICAFGLEPSWGIFHRNQMNPFNLADDFMETFRPIVDLVVLQMHFDESDALTSQAKKELLNIQSLDVQINESIQTVRNAIHMTVESISAAYATGKMSGISLPQLIPLHPHEFA
ncbi:hypothetical protein L248_2368 [Schleiferilactobacillus shenzhenensis LY-73]|uniref:CRISPR-associated endonuclease Cas1 n=1 Tax=Schleiferilactobacillus shenzhenensis LY-73 TaxID=1231336 RepID=U4TWB6_9LACO|nr:hypothetical protein L248_2368 [Schleiferilactobacillus shenzhenensis LY-73]